MDFSVICSILVPIACSVFEHISILAHFFPVKSESLLIAQCAPTFLCSLQLQKVTLE